MGASENVVIPNSINGKLIVSIGSFAFGKEIKTIELSSSIQMLKQYAFDNASITTIYLPKSISNIENNPFTNCNLLTHFTVASTNPYYATQNGVLFSKDFTKIISYPNANNNAYTLPTTVMEIGIGAFMGAKALLELNIPNTIKRVGENAFAECQSLQNILFEDATSLEYIGKNAFSNSKWLSKTPNGVIYISSYGEGVSQLTVYGYKGELNGVREIVIDESTKTILPNAFRDFYMLENIEIPSTVSVLGDNILSGCNSLLQLTMPDNCVLGHLFGTFNFVGSYKAYNAQKNTNYFIPNTLKKVIIATGSEIITDYAFHNAHSIVSINIPNSLKYIGNYAFFSDNSSMMLENIVYNDISASLLETIGSYAFKDCEKIVIINLPYSLKRINSYAFENVSKLEEIIIPISTSLLVYIGNNAFADCVRLKKMDITQRVQHIGINAFNNCINLQSVSFNLSGDLLEIGSQAFMNCNILSEIETPSNLKRIGDRAFYGCNNLYSFRYNRSVASLEYIGYEALHNTPFYDLLKSESTEDSIIYFGYIAYDYNGVISSGKQVILNTNTISLSPYLFAGKGVFRVDTQPSTQPNTATIVLNPSLKFIGKGAFSGCNVMDIAIIPASVTSIDSDAFKNCSMLDSVIFEDINNLQKIGQNAFMGTPWYNSLFEQSQENSIIYIGNIAHKYKGVIAENTELVLHNDTISISPYAFEEQTGIVSISIPQSITSIGQFAFGNHIQNRNNTNLQTIYIDEDIYKLSDLAGIFTQAQKVILNSKPLNLSGSCEYTYETEKNGQNVVLTEQLSVIDLIVLLKNEYGNNLPLIYVPREYYNQYKYADGWNYIFDNIKPFDGVYNDFVIAQASSNVGVDILYYIGDEKQIVIPNKLNNNVVVGIKAFAFNLAVEQIQCNNGLLYIYDDAFANCRNLIEILLPIGLRNIGNRAFQNCISLINIDIPSNVIEVGEYAFFNCNKLSQLDLGDGIKRINKYAFARCSSLTTIEIPVSIEYMGEYILDGCTALTALIMKGTTPPKLTQLRLFSSLQALRIYIYNENMDNYITDEYWAIYKKRFLELVD